ncbi:MAG: PAS domain S-box protein [Holophagales bacterium]|nr:PAS domain S-box protein [Holophagales bacterium]
MKESRSGLAGVPAVLDETLPTDHERLRLAVEAGHLGVWDYDVATDRLIWDDRMLEIHGISRESFTGRLGAWHARVHPDDAAGAGDRGRRSLVEGRRNSDEFRIVRPDGTVRVVRSDAWPLLGPDGQVARVIGLNHDVTEERHAQDALRASEAKFRFAVASSADGFLLFDRDGTIEDVNDAYLRLTGWTREELIGRSVTDHHVVLSLSEVREGLEAVARTGAATFESLYRTRDGAFVPVEVHARLQPGDGARTFAFVKDLRAAKRAEGLLKTRLRLSEMAPSSSLRELMTAALDAAEELTFSRIGFFHFVGEDQETLALEAWSSRTLSSGVCSAEGAGLHYPLTKAGVWADCVRTGRSLVHNDYTLLPERKGLPAGHAPIVREATVPVVQGGRVLAIMGVGNKPWDYDDADVSVVEEIASVAMDLVERSRAVAALRESESKYRSLFETLVQGVVYHDAGGGILSANPAATEILGLSVDELTGRSSVDPRWCAVHEDGSPWPGEEHPSMAALRSGVPVHGALMGVFNPRRERTTWIRIDAVPEVKLGESVPWRVYTNFRDVTEQVEAERALQRSEERLRLSLEASGLGTWEHDFEAGVFRMDEVARGHFGFDAFEVPLEAPITHFHPEDRDRILAEVAACAAPLTGSGRLSTEYRLLLPGGTVRWLAVTSQVLFAGEGSERRPLLALGTSQDVTARKREEEERLKARTLTVLGSLAAGVAHDLNNVLLAVRGNAQLAQDDLEDGHPARESLTEIDRAGRRAADLVQRILSFSRPARRGRSPVDLAGAVAEALRLIRPITSAAIEIRTSVCGPVPVVLADGSEVEQMLVNLFTNAAHAIGSRPGRIDVRIDTAADEERHGEDSSSPSAPATYARLTVTDDGCGMSPETLEKAFDPLFSTKPHGKGTGLGLTMVRMAMERCGGRVSAESRPGEGSTFRLLFPVSAPLAAEARPVPRAAAPRAKGTLLFVDDDDALVLLGRRMLERIGYTVVAVTDPREALQEFRLRPGRFDAVVTDLSMPGLTGFELAREVLAVRPGLPIIATSGYLSEVEHETARQLGIRELILKPDTVDELAATLLRLLGDLRSGEAGARGGP